MSGHTDAVYQTTMHQASPGRSSDVGVVSPVSEPGFLALAPAMYRRTYLELGALLTAPSCARLHTKQLLWEWGLDKLTEISEAIVSELVTNAYETTIRHSLDAPIRLRLSSNGQVALIEVWDADPTAPRVPALDANHLPLADAESGRGLFLVASLSERWSCYTTTGHAGKVVWAECALEAPDCIPGSAGRNLEDIPGSMAYLASKGKGDRSMPLKRWSGPGIRDGVPQDPRNMSES